MLRIPPTLPKTQLDCEIFKARSQILIFYFKIHDLDSSEYTIDKLGVVLGSVISLWGWGHSS